MFEESEISRTGTVRRASFSPQSNRQDKSARFVAAIIFLMVALTAFMMSAMTWNSSEPHALGHSFFFLTPALGIMLLVLIVFWARRQQRFDLFEFPVWFSLNVYIQVILNVWLLQSDIVPKSPWLQKNLEPAMGNTIFLFGLGLTMLWGGYIWTFQQIEVKKRLKLTYKQWPAEQPRYQAVFGLWFVTWTIRIVSTVAEMTGYSSQIFVWANYLHFVSILHDLTVFILAYRIFKNPSPWGWTWIAVTTVSYIGLGLINGTKSAIFIALYIFMASYYARRRFNWRWVLFGILLISFVVPTVGTYRQMLRGERYVLSQKTGLEAKIGVLRRSISETLASRPSDLLIATQETFELRQGGLLEMTGAVLVAHTGSYPKIGDQITLQTLSQLIPRVIWPGKAVGHIGIYRDLHIVYLGLPNIPGNLTPIGLFADAYRFGGWLFVVAWFFIVGAFGAWLYQQGPRSNRLLGTSLYFVFLIHILAYSESVSRLIVFSVHFGIVIWFVLKFVLFASSRITSKLY